MNIGFNLLYLLPGIVGGTETYAMGLLSAIQKLNLDHNFILFVNKECSKWASSKFPMLKKIVCSVSGVNRYRRYVFEQLNLPQLAKENQLDVMHSLGYTSPLCIKCHSVVTIHDLNFKAFGNEMPLLRRMMLSYFVRQSIFRSTKVITDSQFSRSEILRYYDVPVSKITVTHLATDILGEGVDSAANEFIGSNLKKPYFVAFSSVYPNKNIPNLIRAYIGLREREQIRQQLVLIGHRFDMGNNEDLAYRMNEQDDIVQTGYLPVDILASVLKNADFLVFPSYYEGFGFPILEAMAVGLPVACSNAGSLPEVAGESALLFDPYSVDDMAAKMALIGTSQQVRSELRIKGYENLKRFSWDKTARQTVNVYECISSLDKMS